MRIGLVGNCQMKTVEVVLRHMLPESTFTVLDFSTSEALDEGNRKRFSDRLEDVDFVFYQFNTMSHVSATALRERYPNKLVSIGNFFFRGYFPDICQIGGLGKRLPNLLGYHSAVIVRAYMLGKSVEECVDDFSEAVYAELGLLEDWNVSLDILRERDQQIDFPVADIVAEFSRDRQTFLTINHPSLHVISYYLDGVCKSVGLPVKNVSLSLVSDPLQAFGMPPVHDFLAEHHDLKFRTTPLWKMGGAHFVDTESYVRASYRGYDSSNLREESFEISSPSELRARGIIPSRDKPAA